ncbi:MAG: sigma 54-interacting transcriptional regulator, partial [Chlamydiota bacterium]|nr:sigma 54-interacting transcriptional regulator [Chlamydiota bacterium]
PIHKELSCLIGKSDVLLTLLEQMTRIADSEATVFISGEVGSGKGLVAQSIHQISHRREANFVEVNCAAIPESLLESELFGIEKGVATGVEKRMGKFEHAHEGTLFLDEIADTTLLNQAKLLKAIQEKQIIRVGAHTPVHVDVRILTATNRNLKKLAQEGLFRQDLLSRINVINLHVPALRERTEDIPVLIYHFLRDKGRLDVQLTMEAIKVLKQYRWPHNIRELQNEIEQIISFAQKGKMIGLKDLSAHLLQHNTAEQESALDQILSEEDLALLQRLRSQDFNLSKVAHALSKSRDTVDQHLKGIVFSILDACDVQIKEACMLIGGEERHLKRIESKVRLYLDALGKHINKYGKKKTDLILKSYRKVPSRFHPHIESIIQKIISSS